MIATEVRRRADKLRASNPLLPIARAVEIARYELDTTRAAGAYPFLADLNVYPPSTLRAELAAGVSVTVHVEYDDESRLGDDDVTGYFADKQESRAVRNTCRNWNSDADYYVPPNIYFSDETPDYYARRFGMSRSVALDYWHAQIARSMRDDSHRSYVGLSVRVTIADSIESGAASLWGIDVGSSANESRAYLIECAADLIGEALDESRAYAKQHVDTLRDAVRALDTLA